LTPGRSGTAALPVTNTAKVGVSVAAIFVATLTCGGVR
jgi:hypothetical protein